jgi:guanylate kinase
MSAAPGNLFILAAPSGAGKSSLLKALLSEDQQSDYPMQVSISHTTRSPRPNEVDGEHYHFVTRETFEKLIAEGIFFEWAEVFGNYYGTSRPVIEQTLNQGVDVFLDIDWQGARQVKTQLPNTVSIFIAPPSEQALRERLTNRQQDSAEIIAGRMAKARDEISHYQEFDYIVVNDDFDQALADLSTIVASQRLVQRLQSERHKTLFASMQD